MKLKANPKFFWSYANRKRKTRSRIPPLQMRDGSLTDVPKMKAELFQSQFTSVFSTPSNSPSTAANNVTPSTCSISDIVFSATDIEKALYELNPYSAGPSVYPTDPTPVHLNHNLHSHLHTDQVTNKGVSPIRLVTKYDTKHYSIISSIKGHLISKDKMIEKKAGDVIKENQHCCVVG